MRRRRETGTTTGKVQHHNSLKRRSASKAERQHGSRSSIEKTSILRLRRERDEARDQRAATAEVLEVISNSRMNIQPVFDAIVRAGARLFPNAGVTIAVPDGDVVKAISIADSNPERAEAWRRKFPVPLTREYVNGVVILDRRIMDIPDVKKVSKEQIPGRRNFLESGYRGVTILPLMRGDEAIGALSVVRVAPGRLSNSQMSLLKIFANQAIIAIENTRLVNELRQRTVDLTHSLEELRTTQDRLVQTEKLASLGQLTAGIAHEIKNPLNFVNNFSGISAELIGELQQTLSGLSVDAETQEEIKDLTNMLRGNLEKVVQHGKRADAIVKGMLLHSGESSGQHRSTDINALVEESLNRAYYNARAEQRGFAIKLERSFDPTAGKADLFPREITRALLNLISNGFYAATKRKAEAGDGDHEPTLAATTKNLGGHVEIRIRDNGIGIPAKIKEKMFDPFFTTKPAGEGTGLGLSISHDIIVKQHGGSIEVDTQPGVFTEIRVILPRAVALLPKRS